MKERISQIVEKYRDYIIGLSDRVWDNPEEGFKEYKSSEIMVKALRENGFEVETGLAGLPTAFKASYGSGKPVIGFLGEFDALSGLSQKPDTYEACPIEKGAYGHGCGHNTMCPTDLGAMLALKELMDEEKLSGTIVLFGCPAEETGGGKVFMTRAGVFDGVDIAISAHPIHKNWILDVSSLSVVQAEFAFTGVASHASGAPEHGRSALDAAELMVVGIQFLREHVVQEARMHHAYLDVGGTAPNVVQPSAKLLFFVRAPKGEQVKEIFERVKDVARGAALMTGTTVDITYRTAMMDYIPNHTVGNVLADAWAETGPCAYSAEAMEVANKVAPLIGNTTGRNILEEGTPAYVPKAAAMKGSTDVGDVSYVVPTGQLLFQGWVTKTPPHSWQAVLQSRSPLMHDAMIHASKVLALACMKLLRDPALVEAAKDELMKATGGSYESLLPPEVEAKI